MKRILMFLLILVLCCGCAQSGTKDVEEIPFTSRFEEENVILLTDKEITFNGEVVGEEGDVFVSRDIIYYEDKESYESGYPYGEGEEKDRHTAQEAQEHLVLNITKSGAYRISGSLSAGQIRVDLGEDAEDDPNAVAELILDDADITCSVAPAILFSNVYECDREKDPETATKEVDTKKAGAVLVLDDGSKNNIQGSYVAKIFKDGEGEKKLWKQDAALYSYMSMNVFGSGKLNLTADNEGMDTECHLTINGGDISIISQNDGINTNEDGVSVTTINGGNVHIIAGLGEEGDGIDSNGWLVINGGNVVASANPVPDSGFDSDKGTYINGGTVVAMGSRMDGAAADSAQVVCDLQFAEMKSVGGEIVVADTDGKEIFSYKCSKMLTKTAKERNFRSIILSSPVFEKGKEYTVLVDGKQQEHTGNTAGGRGGFGGMEREDMPEGERPQRPEGERPHMPEGERPQIPEGGRHPMQGGDRSQMTQQEGQEMVFTTEAMVNHFTGVSDKRK